MKFVHIADMHFDAPFTSLNSKKDLSEKRRLEQRNVFRKVIEYIEKENVEYLFISGDLYEHKYIRKSTIEYIDELFRKIPNTKIFISPGNHDPYVKDSFYDTFEFSDNVFVFRNSRVEKYEDENVNIFGIAFTDFYMNSSPLESLKLPGSNKPNILVAHVDLNGSNDIYGFSYNPILESKLATLGFDYCAIGHIHKNNTDNPYKIYYPGSTIALGFDEPGKHGMIVGDITKNSLKMNFVSLDDKEFVELNMIMDEISSKEKLIEEIKKLELKENYFYKIGLIGKRNFEINPREIFRLVDIDNVLKISDYTKPNIDIQEIANQNNLKGYFVRELLDRYERELCTEEEFQKALEIGLSTM